MNRYAFQQLFRLLFGAAFGLCALAAGLSFGWQSIQLHLLYSTTTGTVTRVDFGYDSDNDPQFAPEIEYEVEGERYHFRSERTSGNGKKWVKGQSIAVHYDPRHPATAEIGSPVDDIGRPTCFTLAGGLLLSALLFNMLKQLRAARRTENSSALPPYHYPQ